MLESDIPVAQLTVASREKQKRSLVELRHQASSLSNPWVVARDESGPRYSGKAPSGGVSLRPGPDRSAALLTLRLRR
jgi:hypothetical protein